MDWRCLLINFALIISWLVFGTLSQLIRDRSVQCTSSEMIVNFEFSQPFFGVIYSNRFYASKECKREGNASRQMQVAIPLNSNPLTQPYCGVQLKESTGEFTVTLIISPMKGLLVDGMEGLTVRCVYNVGDVTLTLPAGSNGAGLLISHQTQAGIVTGSGGNPFLQMAIRDGHGLNGDIIQSAQVGQRLSLDVVMSDTTIYDFYVHDCYAHDGTNTPEASISVVDESGCAVRLSRAVDVPVFTTAPVPNSAKHVYVHMYGFQFTTSQLVYFECQVRPCLQACNRAQCISGSSVQTTPSRIRRDTNSLNVETVHDSYSDNYNLTTVIRIEPQELVAVVPAARDGREPSQERISDVCISLNVGVTILVIFFIVCLVSFAVAVVLCYRVYKENKNDKQIVMPSSSATATTASGSAGFYSPCTSPFSRQMTLSSQTPSLTLGTTRRDRSAIIASCNDAC